MSKESLRELEALALCQQKLHCWGRVYGQPGAPIICARCAALFPSIQPPTQQAPPEPAPIESFP